jgi:hypothetical protein
MCNCKKQPRIETPYQTPEPTPEPIRELTDEEIDWFNNIDLINPLKEDDDE